ncbi:IS3 family transposase [Halomonas sp. M4R5S39]|nr:IS3 family transposase [Halomonas kalidii]MDI5984551.1 IS3 family transposase [Halomonas kalidii]MDI5985251.1 IS3 family transposase [Halomonas kalidii]MDI5985312.1 IS3 family transposase [Halomonas kalidii]MDI5986059.1 IS3 family transposase [Halomonas kalidii]MDI5986123.1 IS3 family transposase [Halomonas kalidii]
MSNRYDEWFKLLVVQQCLHEDTSLREVARQHRLDHSLVRKWRERYRQHGAPGLGKKYSHYSAAFKLAVLERMWRDGLSRRQAATLFDIRGDAAIGIWEQQYHSGGLTALSPKRKGRRPMVKKPPSPPPPPDEERSHEELLKELAYLRAENAYPKKARCLDPGEAGGNAGQKAQAVQGLRHEHSLALLLRAAELPRSTFYYQLKALGADDQCAPLKARIRAIYDSHKGRYGYRRITAALRQAGEVINHKAVQRLMQQLGLKSLVRPKRYRAYRGAVGHVAPNVLDRQFQAEGPNQKWVTDITEFNVDGQKLYLSPIMDLYNGEIVAYQTSRRPVLSLVKHMLQQAFARLKHSDRPLLHSDQGWHYQHPTYRALLAGQALTQSMSRKGNCLDNAAMESFFGTLKAEYFHLNRFDTVEQLQQGLDRYIHYYNHERIRLKLKGLSPVQYRTQALGAG